MGYDHEALFLCLAFVCYQLHLTVTNIKENLNLAKEMGLSDRLAAEVWLAHLIVKDRAFIFANEDLELDTKTVQQFLEGVQEMAAGRPLSQLTGYKEFYGLDFLVNEKVLIPRPESELLVDLVRQFLNTHSYGGKLLIADIGTGSGCILLAILKSLGFGKGIGVEISGEALKVAKENAVRLGLLEQVTWLEGDLLDSLDQPVNIMVANLPYIGRKTFHYIADNVARYEPEVALYGGDDGLDLYRKLFEQINGKSWQPDFLAGEFGFGQQEAMEKLLEQYFGSQKWKVIPDLAGIPRVFVVEFGSPKNV
jgi:release factor glutamine methyltransferase